MELTIKQLTKDTKNDFLDFFDNRAFIDNPSWAGCYCIFFHHDKDMNDWSARSKEDNRNEAIRLIDNNRMKGFLAYVENEVAGWCNVNNKPVFSFHKTREAVYTDNDNDIISIVCFLVYHKHRRKGISSRLLNTIIDCYKETGYKYIEAYPGKVKNEEKANYYGYLSMYEKSGFRIFKECENYYSVRYTL